MNGAGKKAQLRCPRAHERGAAAVEFALVASIFFTLLIGVMELGRLLFYMNSAAEATRYGARVAVVCDVDAPAIRQRMISRLPMLQADNIDVAYTPAGCSRGSCRSVTVRILPGLVMDTAIPFLSNRFAVAMPSYATTLPRESLTSENNVLCQ